MVNLESVVLWRLPKFLSGHLEASSVVAYRNGVYRGFVGQCTSDRYL